MYLLYFVLLSQSTQYYAPWSSNVTLRLQCWWFIKTLWNVSLQWRIDIIISWKHSLSHHCKFSSVTRNPKRSRHASYMNTFQNRSHKVLANSSRHARNVTECLDGLMCFLDIIYTWTAKVRSRLIHPRLSVSTLNWWSIPVNTIDLFKHLMFLRHQLHFTFVQKVYSNLQILVQVWSIYVVTFCEGSKISNPPSQTFHFRIYFEGQLCCRVV